MTVVIDDRILVDARPFWTRRVDIIGVPPGQHRLRVLANSWQLKKEIDFDTEIRLEENDSRIAMVSVPPYSAGYWAYIVALAVGSALPVVIVSY